MAKNNVNKKENKEALNNLKNKAASELGVDLKKENLTAREAGSVGGKMTQEMVNAYKNK